MSKLAFTDKAQETAMSDLTDGDLEMVKTAVRQTLDAWRTMPPMAGIDESLRTQQVAAWTKLLDKLEAE